MLIIQQFIPASAKGRRPGYKLNVKGITIHSTANPRSTAKNEADNVCNNAPEKEVSFHYVVGDGEAYNTIPTTEIAWHAGDGFAGKGNNTTIAVEIVVTGDRRNTLLTAAQLVAKLIKEHNLDITKVYQHYHWSKKDCPKILRNKAYIKDGLDWSWFIAKVKEYLVTTDYIDWADSLGLFPEGKDSEDIVDYKTLFEILYKLSRR